LEIIRVFAILFIVGNIMGGVARFIYLSLGVDLDNSDAAWLIYVSIIIISFVWYRNKLQFSGFIKETEHKKLSKNVSISLLSISVLMLVAALLFG